MAADEPTLGATRPPPTASGSVSSVDDGPRPAPAPAARAEQPRLGTDRYEVLGLLGEGGQGAVYRVMDHKLGRMVAMKVMRAGAPSTSRARFRTETAVTIDLQHPGIVPVHDRGVSPDGRPWYTMPILEGEPFAHHIRDPERPLRRLIDVFARICEAIAYAHERGVVHRDIKPDNVMLGAFGEVRVLDWGLARRVEATDEAHPPTAGAVDPAGEDSRPFATRQGDVMGTPRYMAPEQLTGQLDQVGPATDVYALGLLLGELLTRERPGAGGFLALRDLRTGGDLPPPTVGPEPLRGLCARMTRLDPADRPPDASVVAAEVRAWLENARRRSQSAALVAEAAALEPAISALRAEADALAARAGELVGGLPPHAPVEEKMPGWQLADAAAARRREARLREVELQQTLQSALRLDPDARPARDALTAHYRSRLLAAEARHDEDQSAELQALLLGHDREVNAEWLGQPGRITLRTEPPGAEIELQRIEERGRRRVEIPHATLGPAPIIDLPQPPGSYLVIARAPGHAPARLPLELTRDLTWTGPPLRLLPADALGEDEVYVPAGAYPSGGDPEAAEGLPAQVVAVDGFVMQRFPVTNRAYIEWLDALVADGRADEALAAAPRAPGATAGDPKLAYGRDRDGYFRLDRDADGRPVHNEHGRPWAPTAPVSLVRWHDAVAYARWRAARTGLPWRLPDELEWEKAARGVDRRIYAWGDWPETTWACMLGATAAPPACAPVDSYPVDRSIYGVRGMTGNVREWCANVWAHAGPPVEDGRLRVVVADDDDPDFRAIRGGAWNSTAPLCRLTARFGARPEQRLGSAGFRLIRAL